VCASFCAQLLFARLDAIGVQCVEHRRIERSAALGRRVVFFQLLIA